MKRKLFLTRGISIAVSLFLLIGMLTGCHTDIPDSSSQTTSLTSISQTSTTKSLEATDPQSETTVDSSTTGSVSTTTTSNITGKITTTTAATTTNKLDKQSANKTSIEEYTIIYNKNGLWDVYAATFLAQYLKKRTCKTIKINDDIAKPTEREILVGSTNREESKAAARINLKNGQYTVYEANGRVVLYGADIGVIYAVSDYINKYVKSWSPPIHDGFSTTAKATNFTFAKAKNTILMIGDGMGPQQVAYARTFGKFYADSFPNKGEIITGSKSGVTDSAAAGTALSSGYKTLNGYLGMDSNKTAHKNIRELAYEKGYRTAVLTNDKTYGATPAAFTVHTSSRNNTQEIQNQQMALKTQGKIYFLRGNESFKDAAFKDNLIQALNLISKDGKNFFIMSEEAKIDTAGHNNSLNSLKEAMLRFNDCIAYAAVFTACTPGTVLIVTADHETGGLTRSENGEFKFTSGNHTGVNVLVFAMGSGTEYFNGKTYQNTEIAKFMARILGEDDFGSAAA